MIGSLVALVALVLGAAALVFSLRARGAMAETQVRIQVLEALADYDAEQEAPAVALAEAHRDYSAVEDARRARAARGAP